MSFCARSQRWPKECALSEPSDWVTLIQQPSVPSHGEVAVGLGGMNVKCNDTRLPLIMAAVLVSVLGSTSARAQTTPGAIPDPGTYQGSTQIQQEQDRQAQQYRQQSAPPFQQQPQQPH